MSGEGGSKRKLTERQTAVLAAVERLGRPVMADLWKQFPTFAPSAIKKVLGALEKKGLVAHAGNGSLAFVNGVTWWSTALGPTEPEPNLAAVAASLRDAELGADVSVDPHAGHVELFLPLVELESYLNGLPSGTVERLRGVTAELECRLAISTEISCDPEPRLTVRVGPVKVELVGGLAGGRF